LKKLDLDHNWIHSLDADIFEHTSRVEYLDLSHNPLGLLDIHTTIAISSLVYLKVSNNAKVFWYPFGTSKTLAGQTRTMRNTLELTCSCLL
jgi:hypothetical protein